MSSVDEPLLKFAEGYADDRLDITYELERDETWEEARIGFVNGVIWLLGQLESFTLLGDEEE